MIGYVTLGTNRFDEAATFYDELLALLDAKRMMEFEGAFIAWGNHPKRPLLSIILPHDKQTASNGNGTMVALSVKSPEDVQAMHAKALELGGADEGAPGPRGDGFYASYFRDLDGNKLNAYCMS